MSVRSDVSSEIPFSFGNATRSKSLPVSNAHVATDARARTRPGSRSQASRQRRDWCARLYEHPAPVDECLDDRADLRAFTGDWSGPPGQ